MKRNWKWFVPLILLVAIAGAGGLLFTVMHLMKSSDAYQVAVATALADERVLGMLGEDARPRWLVSGSISTSGGITHADLRIPLKGSASEGMLLVQAIRTEAGLTFSTLRFIDGEGGTLDLLPSSTADSVR